MRCAVVQTNPVFGQPAANLAEAISLMESEPADLYVLPELFTTGYNFVDAAEAAAWAEPADGPTAAALARFTAARNAHVVYGFAERGDAIYNSSALVGPGGLIGVYRKMHLYYKETTLFAPGNLGFPVFRLPFGVVGMMVCFDWFFPESARTLALAGAEIIAHPSNLVMPHCPDAMVTRCLENRVFSATANRIGAEDRGGLALSFIGLSEIVSPKGEILARLGRDTAGIAVRELDLTAARSKRLNEYNDLFADRRRSSYQL